MRKPLIAIILVAVGAMTGAGRLFAHHGNAAYETATPITLKGTVTEWIWAAPHSFLKFDVTDDSGKVVHWVAESSTPMDLARNGVTRTSFKVGEEITITLLVARNGLPVGRIRQVTLPNGQVLVSGGGAQPATAAPPATTPPTR